MLRNGSILFVCVFLVSGCILGCAQNSSAPVDQPSQQIQTPIADQAAQGSKSDVRIWVLNAPGKEVPGDASLALNLGDDGSADSPLVSGATSAESGAGVTSAKAGYAIAGLTFNVHTGGSSTGPQSTGAVGPMSAQPGATITQSPEQHPEAAASVPITVAMPGGAASGSASGATGGGTSTLSASQQAELRTVLMRALQGDSEAWQRLSDLLGMVFPRTEVEAPTTQPTAE